MRHIDTPKNGSVEPEDSYVAEYPGICGGYPVIRETRIPVRLVVQYSRDGATVDELVQMWPTITTSQIRGALDYYVRRPRRVDEDIERSAQSMLSARHAP